MHGYRDLDLEVYILQHKAQGWKRMGQDGLAKEGSKRTSPYAGWKYLSWLWRLHHGGTVREHLRGVREFR